MNINLEIPNDKKDVIIDAFCFINNYQDEIPSIDSSGNTMIDSSGNTINIINPETKGSFSKRMVIKLIKNTCIQAKGEQHRREMNVNLKLDLDEINDIDII